MEFSNDNISLDKASLGQEEANETVNTQTGLKGASADALNTNDAANKVPSISQLNYQDLSPRYRQTNMMIAIALASLITLCLLIFSVQSFVEFSPQTNQRVPWILSALIGLSALELLYHFFADPVKQYALREKDIHYKSGLVFSRIVSQPILRIQHIEIERGPIERLVGLANLQVFSAGGGSYTFKIPGLAQDDAIALRQFILNHKDTLTHD